MQPEDIRLGTRRVAVRWRWIALAVVLLCAFPALILGTRVDTWADRLLASQPGAGALVGLVIGLLALDTVLPVPSSLLATLAGHELGFVSAGAAILIGLCLGNVIGYSIGRYAAAPVVGRLVGADDLAAARARLSGRPGTTALWATRPVPILSEAAVVLAGAARASVARTAAVCVVANVGLAAVYAGLGSAAHGRWALPLGLAGVAGVPVLAAATMTVIDRRRRGAR